ncbi:S24 family peptidase [Fulvimarina endophytica]|uniref:S24 family peptidase n=2 Tax=Fulvimarina endophytica TaxID=2293836 RepID=A0A371X8U5_9HYPH|nr:S24 family peptidase [Fulvimarina endophytica]
MTKRKRNIDGDEVLAIERIFGDQAPRSESLPARPVDAAPPQHISGRDLVGGADLPVYAAARGGDGHIIVTFDPVEFVKRPAPLAHVKEGYGLLVTGDSMVPAYRPGDTALVNPRLPAERGEDVILYHNPPDGEAEATVKHLVAFNDREWTLQQYNPPETFTLSRIEWPICHRVVGKYNRR